MSSDALPSAVLTVFLVDDHAIVRSGVRGGDLEMVDDIGQPPDGDRFRAAEAAWRGHR